MNDNLEAQLIKSMTASVTAQLEKDIWNTILKGEKEGMPVYNLSNAKVYALGDNGTTTYIGDIGSGTVTVSPYGKCNETEKLNLKELAKYFKPKRVIFSDNVTTCIFEDDTKESVKCNEDYFSESVGVALCILNHLYGNKTKFLKQMKKRSKRYGEFKPQNYLKKQSKEYDIADVISDLEEVVRILTAMQADGIETVTSSELRELKEVIEEEDDNDNH